MYKRFIYPGLVCIHGMKFYKYILCVSAINRKIFFDANVLFFACPYIYIFGMCEYTCDFVALSKMKNAHITQQ